MARIVRPLAVDEADGGRQLSLLPDLPLSEVPPDRLNKAVAVVHMYPVEGSYDHFERRVFNTLLVLSLRVWSAMPPASREKVLVDRQVIVFSSTLKEIVHVLRSSSHDTQRIYDAVENLYKMEFKFDVMHDSTEVWHVSSRLITQYKKPKAGTGEIQWEYPPDIFAMLMAPRPYAAIDLVLANNLRHGYSLALYENTCRYLSNPGKLTARLPVDDWKRLLLKDNTSKTYYGEDGYRYFKREVLKKSMAELAGSEACPYSLELIETKGPRNKVTSLQFRLVLKAQVQALAAPKDEHEQGRDQEQEQSSDQETPSDPPRDPAIEATLRKWGVHEKTLNALLRTEDESTLRHHIALLEPKVREGKIKNLAGAFIDSLRRSKEAAQIEAKKEDEGDRDLKAAKAAEAEQIARERHDEMVERNLVTKFERTRREHITANFHQLPKAEQTALFEAFLETQPDPNFVKTRYVQRGLQDKVVGVPFCVWLGRIEGYVLAPELRSIEAFKLHRQEHRQSLLLEPGASADDFSDVTP